MIADPGLPIAHIRGESVPAGGAKGVIEPQGFRHIRDAVSGNGPVGNVVVNLLGPHIVDILGVIRAVLRLAGAHKLIGLEDDFTDAPLANPGVLAARGMNPVHHHTGHRLHPDLPLSARLALD